MDSLRKPFYIVALILMIFVYAMEVGSSVLLPVTKPTPQQMAKAIADNPTDPRQDPSELSEANEKAARPGLGIPYLAILDGLLLTLAILIGTALILPQSIQGRVASIVTLIVSFITLIVGIVKIIAALILLLLMVGLFLAPPFGTIAYLVVWGFFNRLAASTTLSIILFLKLGFGVCMVLAHQGFLKNKGFIILVLVSLLTTVIVSFLQGLVPIILVSITDALAALIVGIIGVLWALFMLIGSIIGLIKGLRVGSG